MPLMKNGRRDYEREYREYHQKPKNRKRIQRRVEARRILEKEGRISKGDGKDVDHKRPLSKGGGNAKSNLRVRKDKSKEKMSNVINLQFDTDHRIKSLVDQLEIVIEDNAQGMAVAAVVGALETLKFTVLLNNAEFEE